MDPSRRAEKRDGFPQETLYVLPRRHLKRARANPALHGLTVTDAGKFPRARRHLRRRENGCEEHLADPITLDVLKSRSHLSVSRISQLFRDLTGHSPIEFVQHQRVQRACYYLDATDDSVGQIADSVGFEDQFYFSRVFRKVTGVSPREYRTRLRT